MRSAAWREMLQIQEELSLTESGIMVRERIASCGWTESAVYILYLILDIVQVGKGYMNALRYIRGALDRRYLLVDQNAIQSNTNRLLKRAGVST